MKIFLLIATDWGSSLIDALKDAGYNIEGAAVMMPKNYRLRRLSEGFAFFVFKVSVYLKTRFGIRSNVLFKKISAFKIPYICTLSINSDSFLKCLESMRPDLILIAGWPEILRKRIIGMPRLGCINCHPSLLPKYRGPDPFYWVLSRNERETGATYHYVDTRIDSGDILAQAKVPILPGETEAALAQKCGKAAASLLPDLLDNLLHGKVRPLKQDEEKSSYYHFRGGKV